MKADFYFPIKLLEKEFSQKYFVFNYISFIGLIPTDKYRPIMRVKKNYNLKWRNHNLTFQHN